MKSKNFFLGLFIFSGLLASAIEAADDYQNESAYTVQGSRLVSSELVATHTAKEHFDLGMESMEHCHWRDAALQFAIVSANFPNSSYGQEAFYHLGVAEFSLQEYDYANDAFSAYLKCQNNPNYFLSAIEYKYAIAEKFRCGAKRRFLGTKRLPKWATGKTMALKIYDEVICAMPSSEMAAQALYSKGCLLWSIREYRDGIEAFQLLCKRFPRSEMTPDCYVNISRVYIDLCRSELQNPDILALAQLNARKFRVEFPKEERLYEVDYNVQEIRELYAAGLYETGRFYEKICQPRAAIIYYYSCIAQFPNTLIAQSSKDRLFELDPNFTEADLPAKEAEQDESQE